MQLRIGFGVDVHRLVEQRDLVIGGVKVPSSFGALGHSDADVLLHAICDALLGAVNLRDIGYHFSDKDPAYKDIDSQILLSRTYEMIAERGYALVNLDATVILERPKLNPFIPEMQKVIAHILRVDVDCVSIKATTHESVDSFGQGEAVKAYATVLVQKHA
jgi:2-C-methyl-D-erythritol 2,4-cyclodiphosphate synthase